MAVTLTIMQLQQLKVELETDPLILGYAPFAVAKRDADLALMLNEVRATIAIAAGILPAYKIFEAIIPSEWSSLTADEKQRIQTILSMGQVDTAGINTRAAFQATFGPATVTRSNLVALLTRLGSRSEALFGPGRSVTHEDVGYALREIA